MQFTIFDCDEHNLNRKRKKYSIYKKEKLEIFYENNGFGDYIAPVIVSNTDACATILDGIHRTGDADKIFIGEVYYLYNIKVAQKFKLPITKRYITQFFNSKHNTVKDFDFAYKAGLINDYDEEIIDTASSNGRLDILEWFKNSGLPLKYSEKALEDASACGQIKVLDWWLKSGLPLKHSEKALEYASNNGSIKVLDWWLKSGLSLKYTEKVISNVYHTLYCESLIWLDNSDLPMEKEKEIEKLKEFVKICEDKYYKDFVDNELN